MKTTFNPIALSGRGCDNRVVPRLTATIQVGAALLIFAVTAVVPSFRTQAQRPLKVSDVSTRGGANGTTVSISADGSLGKAQTWQDSEGYHVVVPDTVAADSLKTARGVKVRRVGTSLEIVLQTQSGARVQVESSNNKLQLAVDGKLQPKSADSESVSSTSSGERPLGDVQYANTSRSDMPASTSLGDTGSQSSPPNSVIAQNSTSSNPQMGPQAGIVSQSDSQVTAPVSEVAPATETQIQPEDDGWVASVFSGSSVLVVMALGLIGLLVSRKLRSRQALADEPNSVADAELVDGEAAKMGLEKSRQDAVGVSLVKEPKRLSASNGSAGLTRETTTRLQVAGPASLFGAYRIDQEVGKLVFGQPHRLDVLSSRAVDDRRAIETSLIKSVNSPDLDENGRRKAREALEEYGFVARQCAALLLAPDAFDRSSAARALGEIRSPSALPFLLEGLYDPESIVRNQAVMSIGELKLPSAIGALLDIARTHPDVPSGLLSRTLSACSVEGLDFFDAVMPEPALLGSGMDEDVVEQITHLEPTSSVQELPETADDDQLSKALALVSNDDVQIRAEGLKSLGQFRVQRAVDAIALIARNDPEANLRSMAISNLGTINHESVFPAILIGMADEAREVRAAAARALNRLSFDRSEAYVRVIETSDEATISSVAKACVQAGIVSQNLDRLATSDHRQAYETFSLICLLAKARMNQPVLNAIAEHANGDVRIKAVHLLACTGQPEVYEQFRSLAVQDGMREDVKTALLEALYKLEQARSKEEETDALATTASELARDEVASATVENYGTTDSRAVMTPALEPESTGEIELNSTFEVEPNFEIEPDFEVLTLEEIEE